MPRVCTIIREGRNGRSPSKVAQKSLLGRGIDKTSRGRIGGANVEDVFGGAVNAGNGCSSERCLRFGDVWSKVDGDE